MGAALFERKIERQNEGALSKLGGGSSDAGRMSPGLAARTQALAMGEDPTLDSSPQGSALLARKMAQQQDHTMPRPPAYQACPPSPLSLSDAPPLDGEVMAPPMPASLARLAQEDDPTRNMSPGLAARTQALARGEDPTEASIPQGAALLARKMARQQGQQPAEGWADPRAPAYQACPPSPLSLSDAPPMPMASPLASGLATREAQLAQEDDPTRNMSPGLAARTQALARGEDPTEASSPQGAALLARKMARQQEHAVPRPPANPVCPPSPLGAAGAAARDGSSAE